MGSEVAVQINGLDVLIAEDVKRIPGDSTVDYIAAPDGEGFVINTDNPDKPDCGGGCSSC
ncbi:hypothetical protein ACFLW2_00065 [Chloroflexota bacterium]